MLHLPRTSDVPTASIYEQLGLKDMPFPNTPVVDPYSNDARRNGTIYATEPVRVEIEKFERLLIRPEDFPNRVRLAYLWSKGDQQSGRGMGKTALLRYFRQRINSDWGYSEFRGKFSAVVVYVAFPSQVDRRYMEQLALSALVDICKNGVLDASRAKLRLDHLTREQAEEVLASPDGTSNPKNLLNDILLQEHGISSAEIDDAIGQHLIEAGTWPPAAHALARGEFPQFLRSFRKDNTLEPLYVPRDTKILDYSRTLLFNDVVYYLMAAGFSGGYMFIDDIENLVDQMTRKHRVEFAKEFALCTVRPGYANTAYNFFSCVLTTHQQASVGLSTAWGEAGLASIARLDPTSPNSVELPLPSRDEARAIIIAHLDHYQVDPQKKGTISPFTEEGIETLLSSRSMLHPRFLLSTAAKIIEHAVSVKASEIDSKLVSEAMDTAPTVSTPDFSEGIENTL